jgi:branched-chain amino acid transport system substrate-binding protein
MYQLQSFADYGGNMGQVRNRFRKSSLAAVVAVIALVATACGGGSSTEAGSEASSDPLVIGISLPLTGDFSQPGGAAKKGYEVWANMVNASGGILGRQVELKILDDASSQEQVVTDYNRLINEDKVPLILGTFSSLLNFPASTVAENNEMVLIAPAGGSPRIFEPEPKYYFFAQQAIAPRQAEPLVNYIKSLPESERPKTAAYVTQDDPFAAPVIESLQKLLEAEGIETTYSEIYPPETTNFQPFASAIAAKTPDIIAQGAVFEDGVNLAKGLIQIGYSPKIMFQTSAPSNGQQYSDAIGIANTEGMFFAVSWNEKSPTPLNAEFVAKYQELFGAGLVPEEDAADAFAAGQVLQAAVEGVGGTDNPAMADWLRANEVETILGPLSWDEIGRPKGDFLLGQWQSGAVEIVAPSIASTIDKVIFPKPAWTN